MAGSAGTETEDPAQVGAGAGDLSRPGASAAGDAYRTGQPGEGDRRGRRGIERGGSQEGLGRLAESRAGTDRAAGAIVCAGNSGSCILDPFATDTVHSAGGVGVCAAEPARPDEPARPRHRCLAAGRRHRQRPEGRAERDGKREPGDPGVRRRPGRFPRLGQHLHRRGAVRWAAESPG